MAQNSMASDFIQNYLAVASFLAQREASRAETEISRQNSQAGLLNILAGITQGMPDRAAAQAFLIPQAERGLNLDSLLALAGGQSPTETSIRAGAANAGRSAMTPEQLMRQNTEAASAVTTGMNQSQSGLSQFLAEALGRTTGGEQNRPIADMLGQAALIRSLTGMSPGAFSLDRAMQTLQPEELTAAARMQTGLQLTAPQVAANALTARGQDLGYSSSMAGNRLGWAQLAQQGELGHLNLALQQAQMQMQQGGRGGLQVNDIPELVKTQQSLTEALAKTTTPAQRQQYLNSLGTINSLLNSLGVPTPQINPLEDVNQFNPRGWLSPSTWGERRTLPMYQPTSPGGAR